MVEYSPFLACYGGGHAQIIGTVAKAMIQRGLSPTVMGFTTGYCALRRMGIEALSVEALVEDTDEKFLKAVEPFLSNESHPDVTPRQSQAYYGLGFRDLADRVGWDRGLELIANMGRKAFEPTTTFSRFFTKFKPSIVMTTTSPRFELAAIKAGNELNIPTLAIGDLFLVKEMEWILSANYAKFICVLTDTVADELRNGGFPRKNIRVTGNPAFDELSRSENDLERRTEIRRRLKLHEKTVILWPAAGSAVSMIGRPFLDAKNVLTALEDFCRSESSFTYIFRAHPNHPYESDGDLSFGRVDNGSLSVEEALLIADVVCVEASTMGLQAALRGLPVICIGYSDYVVYPQFGLAREVETLDQALTVLRTRDFGIPSAHSLPPLGEATENVLRFVEDILSQTA